MVKASGGSVDVPRSRERERERERERRMGKERG